MRILHGPLNIGNQPWGLSRAERRLGQKSDLVVSMGTWLQYPADRTLCDSSTNGWKARFRSIVFGIVSIFYYDVLHHYFGQTFVYPGYGIPKERIGFRLFNFLFTLDLRFSRFIGRKNFMTLQGCDARLAGDGNRRNRWTMCALGRCAFYKNCIDGLDDRRLHLIRKVLPLFDRVFYLNPELGHVVPDGQFLPYANVEIEKITPQIIPNFGRLRIVHAPSDGPIKGTSMILDALEKLKLRYNFELILVQNKTHEEALEIYRSADIAIDQVLAGWYGGFAVEIMAMGKPIACYIRDEDMQFVPDGLKQDLPVYRIDPGNLVHDLAAVLDQYANWPDRGRASRRFVERWHNPYRIAAAMISAYKSPDSVFFLDPDAPISESSVALTKA